MPIDALKRFTSTPLEHRFELHGAIVVVATNYQLLADRLLGAFGSSPQDLTCPPAFTWRVVVESYDDPEIDVESMSSHRLSQNGLALVTMGQKSFFACDIQAHKGVSFVSECFVCDESLFRLCFLPALISLLKESIEIRCEADAG